jgi:RNA polymerase sigma-70 factor (ECF subfamily)
MMNQLPIQTWTRIHNQILNFVAGKVRDKSLAEDIVHDVFLKIYEKSDQLKDDGKVTSWIYQIARNAITDHFRRRSKEIEPTDLDWDDQPEDFNDCVASCLSELVQTLPQKYREVIELTEGKNLSQIELASHLGISYSGAKSRVQRARALLKSEMDRLYKIETDRCGNIIVCEDRIPCGCDSVEGSGN